MKAEQEQEIEVSKLQAEMIVEYEDMCHAETLMSRLHPLGARKAQGQRILYYVHYRRQWVGVLVFESPVLKNKLREQRIGWSNEQRDRRRCHIANNTRFLVLPRYKGLANLASKCLAVATDRISKDWHKKYGIPIVAVETYVDPEHNNNNGTCYTAAGWENLGFSTGYQEKDQERTHSKWYFLKALHEQSYAALRADIPHAILTGVKPVTRESNNNYVFDATKIDMRDLQEHLKQIPDHRKKHGLRYRFAPLLSLCIAASLSGHTQYRQIADWIARLPAADRIRFGLPGDRVPDESTIGDFMAAIDPDKLREVLNSWIHKTFKNNTPAKVISLDGKALRATSSTVDQQSAFLNVYAQDLGIVLQQLPTQKGGGEKTAAHTFLDTQSDLSGVIILADAMLTDAPIVDDLVKKKLRMSSLLKTIKNSY